MTQTPFEPGGGVANLYFDVMVWTLSFEGGGLLALKTELWLHTNECFLPLEMNFGCWLPKK